MVYSINRRLGHTRHVGRMFIQLTYTEIAIGPRCPNGGRGEGGMMTLSLIYLVHHFPIDIPCQVHYNMYSR